MRPMRKLIDDLKTKGYVKTERVAQVMMNVDRAIYCPSKDPYADSPHPIGHGATISAPHMHAFPLEFLNDHLKDGTKVLDVGSGTGYLTACFAHMVAPDGKVFGIEHVRELADQSIQNLKKDCPQLLENGTIKIITGDGRSGLPNEGPFDVIHIGATAQEFPQKLFEQLKIGGVMVLPTVMPNDSCHDFQCITKLPDGKSDTKSLLRVRYVLLTDLETQLKIDS